MGASPNPPPTVDPTAYDPSRVGSFRFGPLDGDVLLSADTGEWHVLDPASFQDFYRGRVAAGHPHHDALLAKGFLRGGVDAEGLAARIGRRKAFLGRGPHLHIVVTTTRCNQACGYCHASRVRPDEAGRDMDLETARKVVDLAFRSPSPSLVFEFQGGEPTLNFEAVRFVVDFARERNRSEGRHLEFSMVTNLTAMDEEKLGALADRGVMLCTSLDGPADLHDANRAWTGGSAHAEVVRWLERIPGVYAERGYDPDTWRVDALMTTTRASLGRARDIVDEYERLGLKSLHVRPLNPFGYAVRTWEAIGYAPEAFTRFYDEVLDHVLARARAGVDLHERAAAVFLGKILTPDDPGYVDIRSPCGAGTGQLAYDPDGGVYTCDEGRMLGRMGNRLFRIGEAGRSSYPEIAAHPTVKSLAVASTLEALPVCESCVYAPFCGVCPLQAYVLEGDLFGQRPRSPQCRLHRHQIEGLLRRLRDDPDGGTRSLFERWTRRRPRPEP